MAYHMRSLDVWTDNLFDHRDRLKAITSPEFHREFRKTLKAYRYIFGRTNIFQLQVVVAPGRIEPC